MYSCDQFVARSFAGMAKSKKAGQGKRNCRDALGLPRIKVAEGDFRVGEFEPLHFDVCNQDLRPTDSQISLSQHVDDDR
jgi:hypothetical protein